MSLTRQFYKWFQKDGKWSEIRPVADRSIKDQIRERVLARSTGNQTNYFIYSLIKLFLQEIKAVFH